MRTGKITAIVRLLILCLTICQFTTAGAQSEEGATPAPPQGRKAKNKRKKARPDAAVYAMADVATQSYRADELEIEFATSERSDMGRLTEQHQWLTADESVTDPIPKDRMIISSVSLVGGTSSLDAGSTGPARGATSSSTNEFGPVIKFAYGLSENSYLSATVAYLPGTTSSTTSGSGPVGGSQMTLNNDGWREPKVAVGASFRVRRQTRITAELGGTIPFGSGHTEATGNSATSNGLAGGGSLVPRLAFVSKAGPVKFVTNIAYNYFFDRHTDWVFKGVQTNRAISGGNLLDTSLGLEFPNLLNLGIAGLYKNEASKTTSSFTTTTATSVGSSGVQHGGARVYMGIPIRETDIVILPSVTYLSVLNEQIDGLTVARSEDWRFALQGIIHF